ncbi:glycosyltransferase family A protein [Pedobacter nyackensis]|uniref:glycosyltransferase n=1 Tax=Pedobacter nyackensis TaxID=475255 RepID=UPI00292E7E1A|nr:glycosyltransferase family A protein [Pedobacter nyackensis]
MPVRPITVPAYIKEQMHDADWFLGHVNDIRENLKKFSHDEPDVTVVVPAFNEEKSILRTISSLARTITDLRVEILVVNNNSNDNTQALIEMTGVSNIIEYKQGVKHARASGLAAAKGKIIMNADADSVYSPYWVDLLSKPLLENEDIACAYGRFAFLPDSSKSRIPYFLYETIGDIFKSVIQRNKEEAYYAYGCSTAYRKTQGLEVGGYEHPPGANEDGYLALKLREKFGRLYGVKNNHSLVWTSDRQIIEQGGVFKAFTTRLYSFSK